MADEQDQNAADTDAEPDAGDTGNGNGDTSNGDGETDVQIPTVPVAALEKPPDPTPPEGPDTPRDVIRAFLNGETSFPEATDNLAAALARKFDIPYVPGALEERLLQAVADLIVTLLEEIAR
jgi:hypothetical protein